MFARTPNIGQFGPMLVTRVFIIVAIVNQFLPSGVPSRTTVKLLGEPVVMMNTVCESFGSSNISAVPAPVDVAASREIPLSAMIVPSIMKRPAMRGPPVNVGQYRSLQRRLFPTQRLFEGEARRNIIGNPDRSVRRYDQAAFEIIVQARSR